MEEVNFKVVQGDTFTLEVTYKDPNGSAIDLTGYTAKMDVRDKPGGKILCASANELNNGIVIDDLNGKIIIKFSSSQTKKFTVPNAAYQLQIDNNQEKITLMQGYLQVATAVIK
jgi:hypothetical protein